MATVHAAAGATEVETVSFVFTSNWSALKTVEGPEGHQPVTIPSSSSATVSFYATVNPSHRGPSFKLPLFERTLPGFKVTLPFSAAPGSEHTLDNWSFSAEVPYGENGNTQTTHARLIDYAEKALVKLQSGRAHTNLKGKTLTLRVQRNPLTGFNINGISEELPQEPPQEPSRAKPKKEKLPLTIVELPQLPSDLEVLPLMPPTPTLLSPAAAAAAALSSPPPATPLTPKVAVEAAPPPPNRVGDSRRPADQGDASGEGSGPPEAKKKKVG